jgi:hypothetical protein
MVCVGIHVAGWTGIEMAAGGREIWFALSGRVQVDAVKPWLQSFRCESDFNRCDRSHFLLGEISRARDAIAFDVCVGLRDARTAPYTQPMPFRSQLDELVAGRAICGHDKKIMWNET